MEFDHSQNSDKVFICDLTKKLVTSSNALIGDGQVVLDISNMLMTANPYMKSSLINPEHHRFNGLDDRIKLCNLITSQPQAELFNYAFLVGMPSGVNPSFGKSNIYHHKSSAFDEKCSYFKPMAEMLGIYDSVVANAHNSLSDAIVMGDAIHSWVKETSVSSYNFRFPNYELILKRSTRTQLPKGRYSFLFMSFIMLAEDVGKIAQDCILTKVHLDVEAESDKPSNKKKRPKKETDDVTEELER